MEKILFASTLVQNTEEWLAQFRQVLPGFEFIPWDDHGARTGAELAIVWNPPVALMQREPQIRALFNLAAGVDALLSVPGLHPGVDIFRLEDAGMAPQMIEYAVHALLQQSRDFARYARQQKQRRWAPHPTVRRAGWPVGVLGMGLMGQGVARAIAGLGYPVAGWSRSPKNVPGVESFSGMPALDSFLARTRVLINVLPLTDETRGILNRDTFARLLPHAHVINVGRGGHLVEDDLIPALDAGSLSGATLDVFQTEPLPAGHPFWADERIIITPHVAADTVLQDAVDQVAGKIRRYLGGHTPTGQVRLADGY
ncbi:2-hydroxyacid dehydrogenase [Castellaniella sp.]|uniref:2-hydroxyacid dehydrogenase n=1 Tax=Castellaniella sp. TaxID=1955812 RepID=UPI003567C5E5